MQPLGTAVWCLQSALAAASEPLAAMSAAMLAHRRIWWLRAERVLWAGRPAFWRQSRSAPVVQAGVLGCLPFS
jgi:predicted cobalt transporter CbtA